MKAYCPPGIVNGNPVLDLVRYIIFHQYSEFVVERPSKWGGNMTYYSFRDLERDFLERKIHPVDLKRAASHYINIIVDPIRTHFEGKEPSPID
jgi:tyrosyl-tRNA synthetase